MGFRFLFLFLSTYFYLAKKEKTILNWQNKSINTWQFYVYNQCSCKKWTFFSSVQRIFIVHWCFLNDCRIFLLFQNRPQQQQQQSCFFFHRKKSIRLIDFHAILLICAHALANIIYFFTFIFGAIVFSFLFFLMPLSFIYGQTNHMVNVQHITLIFFFFILLASNHLLLSFNRNTYSPSINNQQHIV